VTLVQEPHGRDQADPTATGSLGARPGAHVVRRCELVHALK
jgi:hypothetical protein